MLGVYFVLSRLAVLTDVTGVGHYIILTDYK